MTIYYLDTINNNYDMESLIRQFYSDNIDIAKIDPYFYRKRYTNITSAINAAIKRANLEHYMYSFSTHGRVYLIRDDLFDKRYF